MPQILMSADRKAWQEYMLTRIITSAVGIVIFFGALFAPPVVFSAAIFAVTAIMLAEMFKVLSAGRAVNAAGFVCAAVIAAGTLADVLMPAVIAVMVIYLVMSVLMHTKINAKDIFAHGFVSVFITLFMCFIIRTRMMFRVGDVMWVFIMAWMTDTGAYFAGVFLGKHKLVPHISPKKTVEGAVGGIVICVASCVLYRYIMSAIYGFSVSALSYAAYAAAGLIGSALAQIGDFSASCIKRDYGVKDYGSILPGHGGLMDRFDSVVFIAPYAYCVVWMLTHAFGV